tara:strand:+ start:3458 stop:3619 length:162 start_codon:yes stop_codon:yes gene_type:complete
MYAKREARQRSRDTDKAIQGKINSDMDRGLAATRRERLRRNWRLQTLMVGLEC